MTHEAQLDCVLEVVVDENRDAMEPLQQRGRYGRPIATRTMDPDGRIGRKKRYACLNAIERHQLCSDEMPGVPFDAIPCIEQLRNLAPGHRVSEFAKTSRSIGGHRTDRLIYGTTHIGNPDAG